MEPFVRNVLLVFAGLFPIVNPVGMAPIFAGMTFPYSVNIRRTMAMRIAVNGIVLLVASIFVGTLGSDGSIGGIVEKMLRTPAQRRQDQPPEVTMNGALYLIGWDAMRKHRKVYADPAASYGIVMDRLHSIEIEGAADLAYASYVIEHDMLDTTPWRSRT